VNNGEPQLEIFKISKIAKFGCFGYWLNSFPLKEEFTALTLDKEYLFRFTLPYPQLETDRKSNSHLFSRTRAPRPSSDLNVTRKTKSSESFQKTSKKTSKKMIGSTSKFA
jgi:hypothetical protein